LNSGEQEEPSEIVDEDKKKILNSYFHEVIDPNEDHQEDALEEETLEEEALDEEFVYEDDLQDSDLEYFSASSSLPESRPASDFDCYELSNGNHVCASPPSTLQNGNMYFSKFEYNEDLVEDLIDIALQDTEEIKDEVYRGDEIGASMASGQVNKQVSDDGLDLLDGLQL
jgi:hypothetical protein